MTGLSGVHVGLGRKITGGARGLNYSRNMVNSTKRLSELTLVPLILRFLMWPRCLSLSKPLTGLPVSRVRWSRSPVNYTTENATVFHTNRV